MLATGMGSFDGNGLPLVMAMLGFDDPEALMERLLTIKTFKKQA